MTISPNDAVEMSDAGLSTVPAIISLKRPTSAWKPYTKARPSLAETTGWFADDKQEAICIICGKVSGNVEMIDFDQTAVAFPGWFELLDAELRARLVIESSQSGGKHAVYRCVDPVEGNQKLASRETGEVLVETRGEGGIFLCAPTPGYTLEQGDWSSIPVVTAAERASMLAAARSLNELDAKTPPRLAGPTGAIDRASGAALSQRPGDDFNERGEVERLLKSHGWTQLGLEPDGNHRWRRPGKDVDHSATMKDRTFYVFSTSTPLESEVGLSPFAVYAGLEHGNNFDAAARELGRMGYGSDAPAIGVDLSYLLPRLIKSEPTGRLAEPEPMPDEMYRVPGFVGEVMDWTMSAAPYPNLPLAFCGAMALMSFLGGQKVRTQCNLRTNVYLIGLAPASSGKNYPREVNSYVLDRVGLDDGLGDRFASGEGIQDALLLTPTMLIQADEIDGIMRQIKSDKDGVRESIPAVLMTLYSSSSTNYPIRMKSGQKGRGKVRQPNLTVFGTATPAEFYSSLSHRMMVNGFFARLQIVDSGKRGRFHPTRAPDEMPESIIETALRWAEFKPGNGNLESFYPVPMTVPADKDAQRLANELGEKADTEYDIAEEAKDDASCAAWGRTLQQAKKLSLIYAISKSIDNPIIDGEAMSWATEFCCHQTARQLWAASQHVAENQWHELEQKAAAIMRKRGGVATRTVLMRGLHLKKREFDELMDSLIEAEKIRQIVTTSEKGKKGLGYELKTG